MLRLPRHVVTSLAAHRAQQSIIPLTGLVFTTERGTALDSRNVTRYLQSHDKWRSAHPDHPKGKPVQRVANSASNGPARPPALPPAREEAEGGTEPSAPPLRGLEPARGVDSDHIVREMRAARAHIDLFKERSEIPKTAWCQDFSGHQLRHRQVKGATWRCDLCQIDPDHAEPVAERVAVEWNLEGGAA